MRQSFFQQFNHHQVNVTLSDQHLCWQRLERQYPENVEPGRAYPLLMLHGAGVAGVLTWGPFCPHLHTRRQVFIPDLRGAGETRALQGREDPFELDQVVDDIIGLLDHEQLACVDVVGYSFGGLVAMRLKQRMPERVAAISLLEPAMLERADHAMMVRVREGYAEAAEEIRSAPTPELGITRFLDLISPHRSRNPRVERMTISRLARRHLGFANALDCVTHAVNTLDRDALLVAQCNVTSVVGGKSLAAMKSYHSELAAARADWTFIELPGTDHSLPFQKPRRLASIVG
ncbi:alpha/beta fold hydrolase [Phytohalomonas tamaricis]|uniref:alpha/beta fold hydrolase n=1 Tax=Phytohalomonas tamaricis TaxID=2081032 RepID=UPI000D0B52E0|nr:alpha/beta hydrolase [Phytohalomonas tamaricis]